MHYSIFTLSLGNPVEHLSRIFARMAGFFEDPTHRDQLVFDIVHHLLIENPGVPQWWPGFCLVFDVIFGGLLAVRLMRHRLATR